MANVRLSEAIQDIIDSEDHMKGKGYKYSEVKRKPVFLCKYCNMVFDDIGKLNKHIKFAHNILHPLIVINNRVVSSDSYFYHIDSAYIVYYDLSDKVYLNNKIISNNNEEKIDILEEIIKNNQCSFSFDDTDTAFTIKLFNEESIDFSKIYPVIKRWQEKTVLNKEIQKIDYTGYNNYEQEYLDGFFNYYVACRANSYNKSSRYDDAFTILRKFSNINELSDLVLSVIAFRRNWIGILRALSAKTNVFSMACSFFDNETGDSFSQESKGIELYVEDDIFQCLDAINEYMKRNYSFVKNYLSSFENVFLIEDNNLKDKVLLLQARLSNKEKNVQKAKMSYLEINSPYFKNERNDFLNMIDGKKGVK